MSEARERNETDLQRALEVKERVVSRLMSYPNTNGVGVGFKEVGRRRTDIISLRVYVSKKLPERDLRSEEVLPKSVEGIPVDVIETNIKPHQDRTGRVDPLVGGISIGNLTLGGSGTLGASVFDNTLGLDLILSNWHVLCGRADCVAGEWIIQPGTGGGDGGQSGDRVATLLTWALTDEVDAAVALLTGDRFLLREAEGIGAISNAGAPQLGMSVRKSGRTTGTTAATITDISANINVDYPEGTRSLSNQISLQNGDQVSRPGDSGSVWVDDSNQAVGLNFAGNDRGDRGFANPMPAVLQALDINFEVGITLQDLIAATSSALL